VDIPHRLAAEELKTVLFVCGRNQLRSPTAELLFSSRPDIEVASAGLDPKCGNPVTPELLVWADIVFVMERAHRAKLSQRFKPHLKTTRVICLDIPDNYGFMDSALIALLQARVPGRLR
jgi:predicted protein tyrosine phosphatase